MFEFKLSIVFPCYNEAGNIENIINSVESALMDRNDVEIILVDNGSTDTTPQVLDQAIKGDRLSTFKSIRIKSNIVWARNHGGGACSLR